MRMLRIHASSARPQPSISVRLHTCIGVIMASRTGRCILIIGVAVSAWPSKAEACSCGGFGSSMAAVKGADLVFVGTVARADRPSPRSQRNADGSIGVGGPGPVVATFEVAHTYLGPAERQVVVVGNGTDCD